MDEFLRTTPKWILVGGSLFIGLVFILLFNPPYSACDSQFEIFKQNQTPFLYLDSTKKFSTETGLQMSLKICEERNLPGSCFRYFEGLRFLMRSIDTVSYECQPSILKNDEVKKALFDAVAFIVRLAWGLNPPQTYLDKTGWLDTVHLTTYCEIQSKIIDFFSPDDWSQLREQVLISLPGNETLDRKELWNRSIFSLKCP